MEQSNNRYNKLAKNTVIYAIGNFGSKVLSFLIVPLYTYVLTTEEYGSVDLFTTTVGLILPFITLSIQEALMRYMLGKEVSGETAVSNSFFIFLLGTLVSVLFMPIYLLVFKSGQNLGLFYAFLIASSFTQIFSQYLRSSGNMISFTVNGIIVTVTTLISNLLLLLVFKMGMKGYLLSLLFAQIVSALYIIIKGRIIKQVRIRYFDKVILKEMLRYSIPLIPNSLMWWAMAGGDKYIINYFLGDSANGIYSLAMKIPAIINMVYAIFYQAWQMSAIEEQRSEDQDVFYTNIFKATNALLSISVVAIIICVKPLYLWVMNSDFKGAWQFIPVLSLAAVISCYGSFFGVIYAVNKNTKMASVTTFIGAVVNIGFNLTFVQFLGLHGIAIGTLIGYLVVAVIRAKDTYKEIQIGFDTPRLITTMGILTIQAIMTIYSPTWLSISIGMIGLLILLVLYRKEMMKIIVIMSVKLKKRSS